jgi:hypothetical protein
MSEREEEKTTAAPARSLPINTAGGSCVQPADRKTSFFPLACVTMALQKKRENVSALTRVDTSYSIRIVRLDKSLSGTRRERERPGTVARLLRHTGATELGKHDAGRKRVKEPSTTRKIARTWR